MKKTKFFSFKELFNLVTGALTEVVGGGGRKAVNKFQNKSS